MPPVAAIGTGAAIARAFAAKGYTVAVLARSLDKVESLAQSIKEKGGDAHPFAVDVTKPEDVSKAFGAIEKLGPLRAAIFNSSGGFKMQPFLDFTLEDYLAGFEVDTRGAFLFSQAALKQFLAHKNGTSTLIFTGATASVRAGARFAGFAAPKFALRALSSSLAREFGPKGACRLAGELMSQASTVDGVINTERVRTRMGEAENPESRMDPDAIAQSYVALSEQPKSAWTWELDLRPHIEKW